MMLSFKENQMHVLSMVGSYFEKKVCSVFNFLCKLESLIIQYYFISTYFLR